MFADPFLWNKKRENSIEGNKSNKERSLYYKITQDETIYILSLLFRFFFSLRVREDILYCHQQFFLFGWNIFYTTLKVRRVTSWNNAWVVSFHHFSILTALITFKSLVYTFISIYINCDALQFLEDSATLEKCSTSILFQL